MAYRDALAELRRQRDGLFAVCLVLGGLAALNGAGWLAATRDPPPLHVPPDLAAGAVLRPGEPARPNVYAFAVYVWQQLNRWPRNGQTDYGQALYRFAPYLTARCRTELTADLERKGRQGELDGRTRGLQELSGHHYEDRRVEPRGPGVWVVFLDAQVDEQVGATPVKTAAIRYPLRVVRQDVDRRLNPYGLALDCYGDRDGPLALEAGEVTP